MSSQSFITIGLFQVWNPQRIAVENKKTGRTSYYHTYDTDFLGLNGFTQPAQIRSYSPPGSTPFAPDTLIYLVGRVAFSKDPELILIETIKVYPFLGDPAADGYDDNVPEMAPLIVVVGHVVSKAAPIGPSGVLRGFPLNTAEYIRDAVHHSTVHCAFDTSQARWANAPAPFPNTCVQVAGQFGYRAPDSGDLGVIIDHITLNLTAASGSTSNDAGNNPPDGDDNDGGSPSKKRKFRSARARVPSAVSSPATVSTTPSNLDHQVAMEVCPPTPPQAAGLVTVPVTSVRNRIVSTLSGFPLVPSATSTSPQGASPAARSPSGLMLPPPPTPVTANRSFSGPPYGSPTSPSPSVSTFVLSEPLAPATTSSTPVAPSAPAIRRSRGSRARTTNAAESGPAGPSTPRPSLHPPIPHVSTEATRLPPISSIGVPDFSGFPGFASQGIAIHEPGSHLSARQRSKQPDNYCNPDLM